MEIKECKTCKGKGHYLNPEVEVDGMLKEFQDNPEFKWNCYNGVYDITCPDCKGTGIIYEK
jgi:Ribonuclease G/E